MNFLRLSLNLLRRDWRAGEWRILLLALVLAVGSIATVGLFADRVRQVLQQEAHALLGADLRLSSMRPLPPAYRNEARQRGLQALEMAAFPSIVMRAEPVKGEGKSILAEIQAVEEGYPLRGRIEVDDGVNHEFKKVLSQSVRPELVEGRVSQPSNSGAPSVHGSTSSPRTESLADKPSGSIPARGTIWADARLMRRLELRVGDEVIIGALRLRLAARVVRDVDQAIGFASFAPRVMLNMSDLPATGLVQEGSRINYRLLLAGEAAQLAGLRAWLEKRLALGEKLEDVRDARPEIRTALERAERFFGLAALTAVVLAAVALALAARRFISRHLDACAMMRCLGASQAQVLHIFLVQFLLLGLAAVTAGCLLGYGVQAVLVRSIELMRESALPLPGLLPLAQAAASGMALLLGFAFLPLWQLKRVPALRVIRREIGMPEMRIGLMYVSGAVVLGGLFLWQAGSLKLGLIVLAGLAAGVLLFALLARLAIYLLRRLPFHKLTPFGLSLSKPTPGKLGQPVHPSTGSGRTDTEYRSGLAMHHAFASMARHGRANALQIAALGLGGMAMLMLTLVRADLLESWRTRLPFNAPNRFVVNIQPDQRVALLDFFARQQLPAPKLYPMVRGRLVAINQRAVSSDDYSDPNARHLAERDFNLSWSEHLPKGNELVQGTWFNGAEPALSVEEGIARTLGIHTGDTLTYDVAGSQFSAKVVNLRKVQWDSMQVNFFVVASPGLLEDYPASYITSFHLPLDRVQEGDALLRRFPNVLLINTGELIEQVRHIMGQIAQAMGAVFAFTLLSGLAVLQAALLAAQDERIHQAAVLRTLGADSRYLRRLHFTEFAVLGALSGLLAASGAAALGWALAHYVLEIPYHFSAMIWPVGAGGGMLAVTIAGWLATRRVVRMPPLRVLQSV